MRTNISWHSYAYKQSDSLDLDLGKFWLSALLRGAGAVMSQPLLRWHQKMQFGSETVVDLYRKRHTSLIHSFGISTFPISKLFLFNTL